jgi:hypothetical protein
VYVFSKPDWVQERQHGYRTDLNTGKDLRDIGIMMWRRLHGTLITLRGQAGSFANIVGVTLPVTDQMTLRYPSTPSENEGESHHILCPLSNSGGTLLKLDFNHGGDAQQVPLYTMSLGVPTPRFGSSVALRHSCRHSRTLVNLGLGQRSSTGSASTCQMFH